MALEELRDRGGEQQHPHALAKPGFVGLEDPRQFQRRLAVYNPSGRQSNPVEHHRNAPHIRRYLSAADLLSVFAMIAASY